MQTTEKKKYLAKKLEHEIKNGKEIAKLVGIIHYISPYARILEKCPCFQYIMQSFVYLLLFYIFLTIPFLRGSSTPLNHSFLNFPISLNP